MPVIPIVCVNCGAKYKLPPTFKGTQAKCPKCSSIIDVAKQLAEAGNGDSAKPAAADRADSEFCRGTSDRSAVCFSSDAAGPLWVVARSKGAGLVGGM